MRHRTLLSLFLLLTLILLAGCDGDRSADVNQAQEEIAATNEYNPATESPGTSPLEIQIRPTPLPSPTTTPQATPIPKTPITSQNIIGLERVDRLGKGLLGQLVTDAGGNTLAASSTLGVYVFDGRTLTERLFLEVDNVSRPDIQAIALSSDGELLAIGRNNGRVSIHRVDGGEEILGFENGQRAVSDLIFIPDDQNVISLDSDAVQFWNLDDGSLIQSIPNDEPGRLALSGDGGWLAVASTLNQRSVRLYRLPEATLVNEFDGPNGGRVTDIALSPDGQLLAISTNDLSVWRTGDGVMLWSDTTSGGAMEFSPDGSHLATLDKSAVPSSVLDVRNALNGASLISTTIDKTLGDVVYANGGESLATAGIDGLSLWQASDGSQEAEAEGFTGWALNLALAPDGEHIALGGWNGRVEVWDLVQKQPIQSFAGHEDMVKGMAISPDGDLLVTAGLDNVFKVWQLDGGELLYTINTPLLEPENMPEDDTAYALTAYFLPPLDIEFSPDGRLLALPSPEGVQWRDARQGNLLKTFPGTFVYGDPERQPPFTFSANGALFAYSRGLAVDIVSVQNGDSIGGAADYVLAEDLAFSPDSSEIAILGRDVQSREPFIQVWRTGGNDFRSFTIGEGASRTGWAEPLAYSPDGRQLVLFAGDFFGNNELGFFDAESGQNTHTIYQTGALYNVVFDPSGERLITGSGVPGTVDIYEITDYSANASGEPTPNPAITPTAPSISYDCSAVTEIPQPHCQALVALYLGTDGPNWSDNGGWLQNKTPCSWSGINCSMVAGAITHIMLPGNNLQGSIPKELGDITGLNWLDLSDNRLVGQIPPQLADSGLGQLVLRNNALTGPIPAELGKIGPAMLAMDLANNQLSGELPSSLGELSNLNVLLVNDNSLEGPLPASLVRLSALFYFNFQNTRLCVPADPALKSWLDGLARLEHSGYSC